MNEIKVKPILFVFFIVMGGVSLIVGVFLSNAILSLGGNSILLEEQYSLSIAIDGAVLTIIFWILAFLVYYVDRHGFPKPKN